MSELRQLIKHAERFGVEGVYEAGRDLGADDRGTLERRLREIDPKWRPPADQGSYRPRPRESGANGPTNRGA